MALYRINTIYPLPKDMVIIITLIAGLTGRLLAIRYRLGLPVFNYENND